jgi:twinkle protein
MYFMRFYGSTDVDEVLDAMEYAVYVHDVQHVILDNLQFMMSGHGKVGSLRRVCVLRSHALNLQGYDKFEQQERALDKFRKFASAKNIHLSLVIHPRLLVIGDLNVLLKRFLTVHVDFRKEDEDAKLKMSSVFGTAKATQVWGNPGVLHTINSLRPMNLLLT